MPYEYWELRRGAQLAGKAGDFWGVPPGVQAFSCDADETPAARSLPLVS